MGKLTMPTPKYVLVLLSATVSFTCLLRLISVNRDRSLMQWIVAPESTMID